MIFKQCKDGGPDSNVTMIGIEIKWLFSVLLLRFEGRSRDMFHTHAFNSISWLLKGELREILFYSLCFDYKPSWKPIITRRDTNHLVDSNGISWVLTFRGPWSKTWTENTYSGQLKTLTHGRKEV